MSKLLFKTVRLAACWKGKQLQCLEILPLCCSPLTHTNDRGSSHSCPFSRPPLSVSPECVSCSAAHPPTPRCSRVSEASLVDRRLKDGGPTGSPREVFSCSLKTVTVATETRQPLSFPRTGREMKFRIKKLRTRFSGLGRLCGAAGSAERK